MTTAIHDPQHRSRLPRAGEKVYVHRPIAGYDGKVGDLFPWEDKPHGTTLGLLRTRHLAFYEPKVDAVELTRARQSDQRVDIATAACSHCKVEHPLVAKPLPEAKPGEIDHEVVLAEHNLPAPISRARCRGGGKPPGAPSEPQDAPAGTTPGGSVELDGAPGETTVAFVATPGEAVEVAPPTPSPAAPAESASTRRTRR